MVLWPAHRLWPSNCLQYCMWTREKWKWMWQRKKVKVKGYDGQYTDSGHHTVCSLPAGRWPVYCQCQLNPRKCRPEKGWHWQRIPSKDAQCTPVTRIHWNANVTPFYWNHFWQGGGAANGYNWKWVASKTGNASRFTARNAWDWKKCIALQEMHFTARYAWDRKRLHRSPSIFGERRSHSEIGFEMAGRRDWLQFSFQDWPIALQIALQAIALQEIHFAAGRACGEQAGAPSCKDLVPFSWRARVTIGKKMAPYG